MTDQKEDKIRWIKEKAGELKMQPKDFIKLLEELAWQKFFQNLINATLIIGGAYILLSMLAHLIIRA